MAKYVVPPKTILVKCYRCHALYAPDPKRKPCGIQRGFEICPVCGCGGNDWGNVIPLWKYNLIRFFRCGMKNEQVYDSSADD